MSKFLNISTDNTLGGSSASDESISSQKAVKDYVDTGLSGKANDSDVLKKSGNQTLNGTLTATGFTGNLNGDNYIQWGGPNLQQNVSPCDAGCIDDFGHNKAAFWGGQIDAQYTLDGETWTDISLTDYQKWALVTKGGTNIIVGNHLRKATDGTLTNDNVANTRARVTLHTVGTDGNSKFYSALKKILLNVSVMGAGGCKAKISTRTLENYNNNVDTWVDRGTYNISGWSGWNSIPYINNLGGYNNQTGYNADLRIEFWSTSVNSGNDCALMIKDIRLIGVTNWVVDTVASTGQLYDYDNLKNAYFPANVTVTGTSTQDTILVTGIIKGSDENNTNHGVNLGHFQKDYCDFYEYGAVWNFYKSRSNTNTLIAKLTESYLQIPTPTEDTTSSVQADTVGARNTKLANYALNTDFTGADGTNAGAKGLVPAPAATDNTKFLKGDGTWGTPASGSKVFPDYANAYDLTKDDGTAPADGWLYLTNRTTAGQDFTINGFAFHVGVGDGVMLRVKSGWPYTAQSWSLQAFKFIPERS